MTMFSNLCFFFSFPRLCSLSITCTHDRETKNDNIGELWNGKKKRAQKNGSQLQFWWKIQIYCLKILNGKSNCWVEKFSRNKHRFGYTTLYNNTPIVSRLHEACSLNYTKHRAHPLTNYWCSILLNWLHFLEPMKLYFVSFISIFFNISTRNWFNYSPPISRN